MADLTPLTEAKRRVSLAFQDPKTVFCLLAACVVAIAGIVSLMVNNLTQATSPEIAADVEGLRSIDAGEFASLPDIEYAGLLVGLVDARVVPDNQADVPIVVVDVAVTNSTLRQARLPRSMFRLIRPDGGVIDATRFEHGRYGDRMVIPAGNSDRTLIVFYLPPWADSDLDQYSLEFGEVGRRPGVIPLDGADPAPIEPRQLQAAEPSGDSSLLPVLSATTDVEFENYRARTGQEVAAVTFDLSGQPDSIVDALEVKTAWQVQATLAERSEAVLSEPTQLIFNDGGDGRPRSVTVVAPYPIETANLAIATVANDRATVEVSFELTPLG